MKLLSLRGEWCRIPGVELAKTEPVRGVAEKEGVAAEMTTNYWTVPMVQLEQVQTQKDQDET